MRKTTNNKELSEKFGLDKYPESMTVKQLRECLNIGQSKAYRLVNGKEVETYFIGPTDRRVLKSSVLDYIKRNLDK